MTENFCAKKRCPALCCRNITIHLTGNEFKQFKKHVPIPVTFNEVDEAGLEKARQENNSPNELFFYNKKDIYSDDSIDLIKLFVLICPYLANNLCLKYNIRPKACRVFKFDSTNCQERNIIYEHDKK